MGNSISKHGEKPDIGWNNSLGMAASCEENDYVHKTVSMLENDGYKVSFCIWRFGNGKNRTAYL